MITKLAEVMLYVEDQDLAARFWTEMAGFQIIADETMENGMRWIQLSASPHAETSIILHNKKHIAEMSPELNLGTPSLMFFTENLEEFHRSLSGKGVKAGEIMDMGGIKVFNFADYEENYFAVMENQ
ncbi:VOC family protein [Bacillus mangrovi]|uniref:VOC family protein n=1 Tax=Metabacillus mangrovi TaxID=1491830 RepID=A0A7X2S2A9_9BACI|nr:VOC family protein [Metabacillus mangrovi]MTH51893.1 VOC family protein [Metabacillus mangrovi]